MLFINVDFTKNHKMSQYLLEPSRLTFVLNHPMSSATKKKCRHAMESGLLSETTGETRRMMKPSASTKFAMRMHGRNILMSPPLSSEDPTMRCIRRASIACEAAQRVGLGTLMDAATTNIIRSDTKTNSKFDRTLASSVFRATKNKDMTMGLALYLILCQLIVLFAKMRFQIRKPFSLPPHLMTILDRQAVNPQNTFATPYACTNSEQKYVNLFLKRANTLRVLRESVTPLIQRLNSSPVGREM